MPVITTPSLPRRLVAEGLGTALLLTRVPVRFAPPLVMSKTEADQLVDGVVPLIREFLMKPVPATAAKS